MIVAVEDEEGLLPSVLFNERLMDYLLVYRVIVVQRQNDVNYIFNRFCRASVEA